MKGSVTKTLVPPSGAEPTPPTPPRKSGKATSKETKKVRFAPGSGSPATPAAASPSSAPSGRARLTQLIGDSYETDPFPATAFKRFLGEVAVAGQNLQTETQAMATNLKELGNGLKTGSYKSDLTDTELNWMSDFTIEIEEYLASLNKKLNASPATSPTTSPTNKPVQSPLSSSKSDSPGSTTTTMARFFPSETAGGPTQAYSYQAPATGDHNTRHAAKFESILRDGATKSDYREWRLLSQAFVATQSELKILESSVRDSLIAALGAQTKQSVLSQFGSKLSSKKVSDLIHYLDMRYSFMSSTEDAQIIEDFANCKRSSSQTLATFLQHWRSSLERATLAGYVPSSDISNQLLARATITDAQTARVVEDLRAEEAALGKKLKGEARHKAVYDSLLKAAQVAEQVKLQRQSEKGPLFGKTTANTAQVATADTKLKKRGRGKKNKTHVNTAEAQEDQQSQKPPKKKTKITDPPTTDPAPTTPSQSSVQALADAFTGAIHTAFAKKGGAKGTGKGKTGKGPWQPAGGGKKGAKKGKKGGKKGRGKGKGGKGFDSRTPNQLPPPDWDQSKGAWRCTACNAFNQHWKSWCSWCSQPKDKT